ncbi:MAG TPA: MoaD/ThiS family protein [Planctomycetaceae bacterium]|jgi:molybdopterin synthase sulfur carrier subunit|nr:MoaD/ThiS family protein [Planctomycetaceae bacterium]
MPRVFIPPLLRPRAGGAESLDVPGGSVREIIAALDAQFPGLGQVLCEGDSLRAGLAVVVDGDVSPQGLLQKIAPESEIHFLPAISGG